MYYTEWSYKSTIYCSLNFHHKSQSYCAALNKCSKFFVFLYSKESNSFFVNERAKSVPLQTSPWTEGKFRSVCICCLLLHSKLPQNLVAVMVNCMCQLDWITGCPDNLVKHYFRVSRWRYFQKRLAVEIGRLSKADCPPHCRWTPSNPLRA